MLPIVDKPTIQFIVEEALKSGIEDILVVTGKSKRSIEDHFDSNFELEYNLEQKGKTDLLKLVNDTTAINLHFIRQSHPRGLGDAVLQAKAFVGNEPPEIFGILETQEPGAGNEVQLTDAIDTLNKTQRVFAREFTGDRYDVGDKFGFMKTSIDYALKHPQVKDDLKQYLIDLGHKLEGKPAKKD